MLSTWIHSLSLWCRKNWMYDSRLTPAHEIKTTLGPEPSRRTKSTHVHFKNTARGKQKPWGVCSCTYDVTGNTCQHGSLLTSHDIDPLHLPNSAPPGLTPQHNAAVLQGLCDSQERARTSNGEKLWHILFLEQEEWAGVSTCKEIIIRIYNTSL